MWFNYVYSFYNGFARVQREDNLWNFIDKKGNILSSQWFKRCYAFYDSFARVQREDELWNLMDMNGNILSPNLWFNTADTNSQPFRAYIKDELYYFDIKTHKPHKHILYK